jgi:hypothetical protein
MKARKRIPGQKQVVAVYSNKQDLALLLVVSTTEEEEEQVEEDAVAEEEEEEAEEETTIEDHHPKIGNKWPKNNPKLQSRHLPVSFHLYLFLYRSKAALHRVPVNL